MLPFVFSLTQKDFVFRRNDRGKENFNFRWNWSFGLNLCYKIISLYCAYVVLFYPFYLWHL